MYINTVIYFFFSSHSKKVHVTVCDRFLWPWNDFLCEKENSLKNKCGIALLVNKINTSKRITGWKKGEKHLGVNEREKSEVLFLWECIPHRLAS